METESRGCNFEQVSQPIPQEIMTMASRKCLTFGIRVRQLQGRWRLPRPFSTTSNDNIVRGPWPELDLQVRETLYSNVFNHQDFPRTNTAIIEGVSGKKVSYNELMEMISRVGSALVKKGVGKDDVLAIVSPNSIEFAVQFFATSAIGCVISTINPSFTSGEIAYQLRDCGAKYIATVSSILSTVKEAASQVGVPNDKIIVLDTDGHGEHISFNKLLEDSGSSFPDGGVPVDPESTACLPYSSGTTGLPKGVMLSHRNLVTFLLQANHPLVMDYTPNSVLLCLLPLFHIFGMGVGLSYGLKKGSTLVSLPQFTPESFLRAMSEHKVTDAPLAPPLVLFLAKHPSVSEYDLSNLKEILSGAAPLSVEMAEAVKDRLGVRIVRQAYGSSEATMTHICPADVYKPSSIGPPIMNTEVAVVDSETGERLGVDKVGEIVMRGPQIMKGYLNRPEETAACLKEGGWFHSGDVGMYVIKHLSMYMYVYVRILYTKCTLYVCT